MNKNILLCITICMILSCLGCGETVRGVSKDAHRIGKGVRTVFVSDE